MSWEWLQVGASTAVGLAGIGVAWGTTVRGNRLQLALLNSQSDIENRRVRENMKREVYATVLGGLQALLHQAIQMAGIYMQAGIVIDEDLEPSILLSQPLTSSVKEIRERFNLKMDSLEIELARLSLVGAADVSFSAEFARVRVQLLLAKPSNEEAVWKPALSAIDSLRQKMIADLS